MAKVIVRPDETLESAIRRFKKQVINENILYECKRREYFKSKSLKRKEKAEEALKRTKRKLSKNRSR